LRVWTNWKPSKVVVEHGGSIEIQFQSCQKLHQQRCDNDCKGKDKDKTTVFKGNDYHIVALCKEGEEVDGDNKAPTTLQVKQNTRVSQNGACGGPHCVDGFSRVAMDKSEARGPAHSLSPIPPPLHLVQLY
jgi:hypothetical protein